MTDKNQEIIIGCDHAAFKLKETIKTYIESLSIRVKDIGTHSENSVDYTDFGMVVGEAVSKGQYEKGILICGTGIGMSMVANKYSHVRAALCNDLFSAIMSRRHNNANILAMGARIIGEGLAMEIVKYWLDTPFDGGRHQLRLDKLNKIGR